jgi:hypothetical protein
LAVAEVGLEVHEAGALLAAHLGIRRLGQAVEWMAASAASSVSLNWFTHTRTAAWASLQRASTSAWSERLQRGESAGFWVVPRTLMATRSKCSAGAPMQLDGRSALS